MNQALQTLKQSIVGLCFDNEILRLLIQENWPVAQRLSPEAVLSQARTAHEAEFHSRSRNADTKLEAVLSAPSPCEQILSTLTEWIQETRKQTFDRVQKAKTLTTQK